MLNIFFANIAFKQEHIKVCTLLISGSLAIGVAIIEIVLSQTDYVKHYRCKKLKVSVKLVKKLIYLNFHAYWNCLFYIFYIMLCKDSTVHFCFNALYITSFNVNCFRGLNKIKTTIIYFQITCWHSITLKLGIIISSTISERSLLFSLFHINNNCIIEENTCFVRIVYVFYCILPVKKYQKEYFRYVVSFLVRFLFYFKVLKNRIMFVVYGYTSNNYAQTIVCGSGARHKQRYHTLFR